MMGPVIKLLKSFPNLFQPSKCGRRNTKLNEEEDYDDSLHLPPLPKQKSHSIPPPFSGPVVPVIRIRRARSLKNESRNRDMTFSSSENDLAFFNKNLREEKSYYKSNSNSSIIKSYNSNYKNISSDGVKSGGVKVMSTSDVPRIVAEVIDAASVKGKVVERQMVRIINGADPSVQSQVLLNTKTSQPWKELVKDLGMAVKLPRSKKIGNRMETLYGRQVQSYSQLRSELKVGNNAYYIYADSEEDDDSPMVPNMQHHRLSLDPNNHFIPNDTCSTNSRVRRSSSNVSARSRSKIALSKTLSNSSSELSMPASSSTLNVLSPRRRHRRRSHTPSSPVLELLDGQKPPLPQQRKKSVSRSTSPAFHSNNLEVRSVHFY